LWYPAIFIFTKLRVDTGIDNINRKIAENLGLGKRTGVDIDGEVSGVFPTREVEKTAQSASDESRMVFF